VRDLKITKQYPDCGHSYAWSIEDLQDPDKHSEQCPICHVVLLDPTEDLVLDE
jgi:hypothetical protein